MINRRNVKLFYDGKDEDGNYISIYDYWKDVESGEIDEDGYDSDGNQYDDKGDRV